MAVNPQMLVRIAANLEEFKRNLAEGRNQIETTTAAMGKIAASLRGDKLIQQAHDVAAAVQSIGGASTLTASQQAYVNLVVTKALEKYQALGRDAPAGLRQIAAETQAAATKSESWGVQLQKLASLIGVTFSIGALVGFGRSLIQMGDQIVRVADQTGMTTTEVQKLSFIASQSGNSLDQLTGAVSKMQVNLGSGNTGAIAAVNDLKINLDQLRAASPFQQLEMIAAAASKIPDPMLRSTLMTELLGKAGVANIPTLISNFVALGNAAPVMSDNTVRALDSAGDALDGFKLQLKVWAAESYNWLRGGFESLIAIFLRFQASMIDVTASVIEQAGRVPFLGQALGTLGINAETARKNAQELRDMAAGMGQSVATAGAQTQGAATHVQTMGERVKALLTPALVNLTSQQKTYIAQMHAAGISTQQMAGAVGASEIAVKTYVTAITTAAKANSETQFEKAALEAERLQVHLLQLVNATPPVRQGLEGITYVVGLSTDAMSQLTITGADFGVMFNRLGQNQIPGVALALNDLNIFANKTLDFIPGIPLALEKGIPFFTRFANTIREKLGGALSELNGIFRRAFEGGGGVLGAIQSFATKGVQALLSMIPGVGAFVSQFAGAIVAGFKKLFGGPSAEELAGREVVAAFEKNIQAMLTASQKLEAGHEAWKMTVIGVRDAYLAMGLSSEEALAAVERLWAASKEGPEAAKAAIAEIQVVLDAAKKKQEELNTVLEKYAQNWEDLPEAMQAERQQALLGRLRKDFDLLTKAGFDYQKTLELIASKLTDQEKVMLGITQQAKVDWRAMEEAAKKYGIALDKLGPAFDQAKIDDKAEEIVKDFKMLSASGADVGAVVNGMADEFNELLHEALRTGAKLPDSLRPLAEALIESGQLTDLQGQKLESLGDIPFADPVASGFDRIVDKLEELLQLLGRPLEDALTDQPDLQFDVNREAIDKVIDEFNNTEITIKVKFDPKDLPEFQHGTYGQYADFGPGTLAVLHGRERIMTEREQITERIIGQPADFGPLAREMRAVRQMLRDQPRAIAVAVRDAALLVGGGR